MRVTQLPQSQLTQVAEITEQNCYNCGFLQERYATPTLKLDLLVLSVDRSIIGRRRVAGAKQHKPESHQV